MLRSVLLYTAFLFIYSTSALTLQNPKDICTSVKYRLRKSKMNEQFSYYMWNTVDSVDDCASGCQVDQRCQVAVSFPRNISSSVQLRSTEGFICFRSDDDISCRRGDLQARDFTYNGAYMILCIRCNQRTTVSTERTVSKKEDCAESITYNRASSDTPGVRAVTLYRGTRVANELSCAHLCYTDPRCKVAGFIPEIDEQENCFLSRSTFGSCQWNQTNIKAGEPRLLFCVECEKRITTTTSTEQTTTTSTQRTTTTITSTMSSTSPTTPPEARISPANTNRGKITQSRNPLPYPELCLTELSFRTVTVDQDQSILNLVIYRGLHLPTPDLCAQYCYADPECELAGFYPPRSNHKRRTCFLSKKNISDCSRGILFNSRKELSDPAVLMCFECRPLTATQPSPSVPTIQTSIQPTINNRIISAPAPPCPGKVQFVRLPPGNAVHVRFIEDFQVQSVTECAELCYRRKCNTAAFVPFTNKVKNHVCFLAYSGRSTIDCITNKWTINVASKREMVYIGCTQCDTGIRQNFDQIESTSAIGTSSVAKNQFECAQHCYLNPKCKSIAYIANAPTNKSCFQMHTRVTCDNTIPSMFLHINYNILITCSQIR